MQHFLAMNGQTGVVAMLRKYVPTRSVCLCLLLFSGCSRTRDQDKEATRKPDPTVTTESPAQKPLAGSIEKQVAATSWHGDLDEMVKRRFVRVLVPFSRPEFFYQEGKPAGFLHEAFREFEKKLNERYKTDASNRATVVLLPTPRSKMKERLLGGYADLAAGSISITETRKGYVDFSIPTYPDAKALIVTGPSEPPIQSLDDLSGKEVWVHSYTRFPQDLEAISADLKARGKSPVKIRLADPDLEIADLLEMVNAGLYGITVAQSPAAGFWSQVFDKINIREDLVVNPNVDLAWAMPKNLPKLEVFVNEFVSGHRRGTAFGNALIRRYMQSAKYCTNATSQEGMQRFRMVADLFRKYGVQYQIDPHLLLAQAYQESRLDHSARSPAGAVGIMQLKPSTAAGSPVNIKDIKPIENNIHAGARLMHFLIQEHFDEPGINQVKRGLFAFAAYNAGPARIQRLRSKAQEAGYDPNKWFGNVEVLVAKEVGRETTQYVANIYKYYLAYKLADAVRTLEQKKTISQREKGSGRTLQSSFFE